ncbi:MAG: PQQ-binding-like beta-propeller repeat protein [Nitrosopumilus sp.]|nr:PQQ-binding-like beta-propeller repeat protein [Nitrosopumilus sp.]
MSISAFAKTTALYSIFIVSFLIIFQTSSTIANVLGSTIENPDRISIASSNISFQLHDHKTEDLKKHFETGMEESNRDNWIFVNHDIYGTRNSNQTQIDESNVGDLKVKWRLNNTFEIQDPPIIVNDSGYFQDYIGNLVAFNTLTGNIKWKLDLDGGPTMGLYFSDGIIYATIGTKAKIISVDSTNGKILWESPKLGDTGLGYAINSPPLIWNDYVIAGSGGSGLPPGKGFVKGNITALNKTDGSMLWNIETTTGEWVEKGKNPPNGGATAWSGGSIDVDTGIAYIPLGSASPNFNASTRQSPNLYSNHMVAVDIKEGKIIWATPFIAHGTVLNIQVPDTHDWDTSWGSSVSNVKYENGSSKKIVIGHDKMGNVIAMDALTGEEIWWKTLGKQINISSLPSPSGSGMIWSFGIYNYHAVDEDTLYITATNRGLNFFTDGLSGHKEDPENSIEQGLVNGTIYALDKKSGVIKWKIDTDYPPRVSPLVSKGVVYTGYIKFGENDRTGIILALDKNTGEKLWEYDVRGSISPVGASIGNGMLFVPTDKVNLYPNEGEGEEIGGSIVAFTPIKN